MTCTAVILAAGTGTRFGGTIPKQLESLAGVPIVVRSVQAFRAVQRVDAVVVVTSAALVAEVRDLLVAHDIEDVAVIEGGVTRDASTRAALDHVGDVDGLVLIHDAVRPLIGQAEIDSCLDALATTDAAVVVDEVTDTLFAVDDGRLTSIPHRSGFRRAQTPQGFRVRVLRRAFAAAAADPDFATTDDIGVVHRYLPDVTIALVDGSPENLKITTPPDLLMAEAILAARREDASS